MLNSNKPYASVALDPKSTATPRRWSEYSYRLLAVYCLAVLGLIGLSSILGDRYWPVQAFGYVRDLALLLALVPLPIVI